jgi:hypothetical protein
VLSVLCTITVPARAAELLERRRRDQHRHADPGTEHGRGQVARADVHEHAIVQGEPPEGLAVPSQGHFVLGAARVIVPPDAFEDLPRLRFEIEQVHTVHRRPR